MNHFIIQRYRSTVLIALITAVAFALRMIGIDWGVPNELHALSYHPDETVMMLHSTTVINPYGLSVFTGQLLPHFYNYGTLQLILIDIACGITAAYVPVQHTATVGSSLATYYITGRILTAAMGTVTVAALWALGRQAYNDSVGLVAACLLALTPLHVQHSHFMTVDVPATMWVTFALLWSVKALTDELPLRSLAAAGLFCGLAAGTKYNCALVLLPALGAAFIRVDSDGPASYGSKFLGAAVAVFAALGAFLFACPGAVLENHDFVHDLLFESHHVMHEQELWFVGTGNGWWYILSRNLDAGMSLPLLVAAVIGAAYSIYRRSQGDLLTLAFAVPYYLLIGAAVSRYARYEIPLLPVLTLWAGRVCVELILNSKAWTRVAIAGLAAVVTSTAAVSSILLTIPLVQEDPRDRAETWLMSNAGHAEKIGVPTEPWFYTPPISRFFNLPSYRGWEAMPGSQFELSRLVYNPSEPFDTALVVSAQPSTVVLSEYEYYDRLRLHDKSAIAYLAMLRSDYFPPIVFSDTHPLGGMKTIDSLPCQDLPTDMLYASPTILVYQRR